MLSPIKEIVRFNKEAGLLGKPYDDFLESSFQIEEALEGFDLFDLHNTIRSDYAGESSPKEYSRLIVSSTSHFESGSVGVPTPISDVNRLDKACDSVVYAIGSMAKLGLSPQEVTTALNIVMKKNFEKLNCPKDEYGKLTKPKDFVGPEAELQLLLDRRTR
jgi:hypothetical protein